MYIFLLLSCSTFKCKLVNKAILYQFYTTYQIICKFLPLIKGKCFTILEPPSLYKRHRTHLSKWTQNIFYTEHKNGWPWWPELTFLSCTIQPSTCVTVWRRPSFVDELLLILAWLIASILYTIWNNYRLFFSF